MVADQIDQPQGQRTGDPGEVFRAFLKLGLKSFGGPIAHFGYFHLELVLLRRRLREPAYADPVALRRFLVSRRAAVV